MWASIVSDPDVRYPDAREFFSPSERFPEYRFQHLASAPNPVYAMVRRLFEQRGLDREHFGTGAWNPLGEFVSPGDDVFILGNFVYHRRFQESDDGFAAKCIHGSVLRALSDYVLIAGGRVRFGNSPLQGTDWSRVLSETGASVVLDFYRKQGQPVEARDLRLFVTERSMLGRVRSEELRDDSGSGVEVVLGDDSLLGEIAWYEGAPARFRIADYRPERIEAFHSGELHRYVINRAVLDSQVVISLPKLKTHEKVGITCGVKGFVGMVGHKDCLAHHRFGSPASGGDEYSDSWRVLESFSGFQDWVQSRDREAPFQAPLQIFDRNMRRVLRRVGANQGGAWYGNDTCWRMAVDLTRIAHYADENGRMHDTPQRRHLSLIDGIVAGEGDGPLDPDPIRAGTVLLSDSIAFGDRVASRLMGFDPDALPLVRESFRDMRHPLADRSVASGEVVLNGEAVDEARLAPVASRPFLPARGWRGHLPAPPR